MRHPKALVWVCSIVYVLALPFLVGCAWLSPMVFLNTNHTSCSVFFISMAWMVPLSTIVSICSMWLNYSDKNHSKLYFYCALPILSVVILELCIQTSRLFIK